MSSKIETFLATVENLVGNVFDKKKAPITDEVATVGLYDRWSTYPSKGLTPGKLASLLVEADGGDVARQMELFEEMLEKDGHLHALFQKRRLQVSGRNYSIIPASKEKHDIELANDVDEMIKNIKGWKNAINDILDCVPKAYSVGEIFWVPKDNKYVVERVKQVHPKRFRFGKVSDPYADPEELRLIVEAHQTESFREYVPASELAAGLTNGIALTSDQRLRQRFIVAYCKARSGNPSRASLLRTCTYLFLFKNYDIKWWIQFAEKLLGYRVGKYDPSQEGQKEILEEALRGLATDSSALISKESVIEFVEQAGKAASHQVYKEVKDWANAEMSEVVLGHTGTTESTPGKLGQDDTARDSIQMLVESDASVVDEAITDQIIKTYIDYNYGPQEKYPYYHTEVEEQEDLKATSDIVRGYQQIGGKVSAKWAREKFAIPAPDPEDKEDELLEPAPVNNPFIVSAQEFAVADGKKKLLTRR